MYANDIHPMESKRAWLGVLALAFSSAVLGCTGDAVESDSQDVTGSATAFAGEIEPLSGFSFDTGLIPAGSPAQVSLALSAGGAVNVAAVGVAAAEGLAGRPGSGTLSLDLHVKMDGRLKIDTRLKKVDGDLPGLADIDIPITGEISFDPFLLGKGESAVVEASIPETKLPPIPLGSVPGKLELTVTAGSSITSSFRGTCLSVAGGEASYDGEVTTSGTLILKGALALDLPAPLNKTIDLGEIPVTIPASTKPLAFGSQPARGAADAKLGPGCGGSSSGDGASSGGGSSGDGSSGDGSSSGGSSSGGSSSGGGDTPAPSTASVVVDGTTLSVTSTDLWNEVQGPGKYTLFLRVSGPGVAAGSDFVISAVRTGDGCLNTENFITYRPAGDTQYMPKLGGDPACGLRIDALPTSAGARLKGSFDGTLRGINRSTPKSKNVTITFDVARK
jgi:hypothetical protein